MGLKIDAITGSNLINTVKTNIDTAYDATGKGVKEFVDYIVQKIKNEKMTALRIWGHGFIHNQDGTDIPNGNFIFGTDDLKADNIEQFRTMLAPLNGCLYGVFGFLLKQ